MMTNYITGPPVSHSCIAIKKNGELFVVESNLPGVRIWKYKEFVEHFKKENNTIMWFQLSKENRKKFNETAVWEWLEPRKKFKYGIRAFLPAPIDLAQGTFPKYISNELFILIGTVLNKFIPDLSNLVIGAFMSARLGRDDLNLDETSILASEMNLKLEDLMAMPELESFKYKAGEQWICSALVVKLYMIAGVIKEDINPKEFVPKDIYQMNIFDKNWKYNKPKVCRDADPDDDFCQIHGKYRLHAVNFSRIDVYPRMNERCAMVPPKYLRQDGC